MEMTGFIGLGIMGNAMARALLKAGMPLIVYNRSRAKAAGLEALGARIAGTPADAGRESRIVFSMLSTPGVVEELAWGENGFARHMPSGSLWVDCSTVNPSFSAEMAGRARAAGLRFIDAPVGGSKPHAEKGELVFLLGGDGEDIREIKPHLEAMGKTSVHVGPCGMGASLKMVYNYALGVSFAGVAEALTLGERLGVPKKVLLDTFLSSAIVPPNVALKKSKLSESEYSPEFPLKWLFKDMYLAMQSGYERGVPLPVGSAAKELYNMACLDGMGELDYTAAYEFLKRFTAKD